MGFEGRAVVVTGGSSGIGAACVRAFVASGAAVASIGRDEGRLGSVAASTSDLSRVTSISADLARPGEPGRAVAAAIERLGGLDVLVNNAGVALEQPVLETTEEAWRSTLAVNLDAAVFASIAAARAMLDRGGGAIVNVASTDGLVPEAPMVAYNASKAALLSVTRSMAVELGPYGIRVNAVAPGETATPMTDDELADPRFVGAYLPQIPLRRFSTAEEQAAVILFLASDEASYVNGATLVVDGGQLAGTWYYPWMAPGQQGDV